MPEGVHAILLNKSSISGIWVVRSGFEAIPIQAQETGWCVIAVNQGDQITGDAEFYYNEPEIYYGEPASYDSSV